MVYHLSKIADMNFDDAVRSTKEALKRHDFRVLTEIDMKDNFRKSLNVEFRPYTILGVCNPELTHQALEAEDKVGTMLPCNIVVQRQHDGDVEISAVDPLASMQAITHVTVGQVASDLRSRLERVLEDIPSPRHGDQI